MSGVGIDAVKRRTWDVTEFERKAKDRIHSILEGKAPQTDFKKSAAPTRSFLQSRDYELKLDGAVGKTQIVSIGPGAQPAGFYCEICQCTLKDSQNYLDHINGKKHQRAMGMSMRVEKSTVSEVRNRFDLMKRKREEDGEKQKQDLEEILAAKHAYHQQLEHEKKRRKKEKQQQQNDQEEDHMMKSLGLPSSFGGK